MSKLCILMKCFCSDGVGLWLWLAQVEWAMLSDIYIANKTNYLSNIVNLAYNRGMWQPKIKCIKHLHITSFLSGFDFQDQQLQGSDASFMAPVPVIIQLKHAKPVLQ